MAADRIFRGKKTVYRDAVHGDIRLDPMWVALLDTSAVQRLGRVYQLGYAHLVFRGGTHTRLSHVMGAAEMAGLLVDSLHANYVYAGQPEGAVSPDAFLPCPRAATLQAKWDFLRHITQWAALLHDVGHVPLGHTLEDEFKGIYEKHDSLESPRTLHLWLESAGGGEAEIKQVLMDSRLYPSSFTKDLGIAEKELPRCVWEAVMLTCLFKEQRQPKKSFKVIVEEAARGASAGAKRMAEALLAAITRAETERTFQPYFADIVGNTICADYLDYVQRDARSVGLDQLRDQRIVSRFYIARDNGHYRMALALVDGRGKPRLDVCTGVVELVRQRYRFSEIIHYHKAKIAASTMFAKAIQLIGSPPEVRAKPQDEITINEIDELVEVVSQDSSGADAISALAASHLPSALMDPEVGDESLPLLLMRQAWDRIHDQRRRLAAAQEEAERGSLKDELASVLRAIALLQAIVRRKLYKLCVSISAEKIVDLLTGGQSSGAGEQLEDRVDRVVRDLREGQSAASLREQIEHGMEERAEVPATSFLLYIPARMVQAKGIETFALDQSGQIFTLGNHSAVKEKLEELTRDYKHLWRIMVFVHPSKFRDVVRLSMAADELIERIVKIAAPGSKIGDGLWRSTVLSDLCWFTYIPRQQRMAAKAYEELCAQKCELNWKTFQGVTDGQQFTISSREHALRAYIRSAYDKSEVDSVERRFAEPDTLVTSVERILAEKKVQGIAQKQQATELTAAVDAMIAELRKEKRAVAQT